MVYLKEKLQSMLKTKNSVIADIWIFAVFIIQMLVLAPMLTDGLRGEDVYWYYFIGVSLIVVYLNIRYASFFVGTALGVLLPLILLTCVVVAGDYGFESEVLPALFISMIFLVLVTLIFWATLGRKYRATAETEEFQCRQKEYFKTDFYFTGYMVPTIVAIVSINYIILAIDLSADEKSLLEILTAAPWYLLSSIIYLVFLYKSWDSIGNYSARITPGNAVGRLFIPFYNFYWMYVVIVGLIKDINKVLLEKNKSTHKIPNIGIAIFVLTLLSFIPYLGLIIGPVVLVLNSILIYKAGNAINIIHSSGNSTDKENSSIPVMKYAQESGVENAKNTYSETIKDDNSIPLELSYRYEQSIMTHINKIKNITPEYFIQKDMDYISSNLSTILNLVNEKMKQCSVDGNGHSIGFGTTGDPYIQVSCWPCSMWDLRREFERQVGRTYEVAFEDYIIQASRVGCSSFFQIFICNDGGKIGVTACYYDLDRKFLIKPNELVD